MIPWDKLHGAMTHFPIALLLFSTACDFVSVAFKKLSFARGLRFVSFYGLAVAAHCQWSRRGWRRGRAEPSEAPNYWCAYGARDPERNKG